MRYSTSRGLKGVGGKAKRAVSTAAKTTSQSLRAFKQYPNITHPTGKIQMTFKGGVQVKVPKKSIAGRINKKINSLKKK